MPSDVIEMRRPSRNLDKNPDQVTASLSGSVLPHPSPVARAHRTKDLRCIPRIHGDVFSSRFAGSTLAYPDPSHFYIVADDTYLLKIHEKPEKKCSKDNG